MTFIEYFREYLDRRCLSPDAIEAILTTAQGHDLLDAMKGRWTDQIGDYPDQLRAVVVAGVDQIAGEWIDANRPGHFARAMFKERP